MRRFGDLRTSICHVDISRNLKNDFAIRVFLLQGVVFEIFMLTAPLEPKICMDCVFPPNFQFQTQAKTLFLKFLGHLSSLKTMLILVRETLKNKKTPSN